ncbi:zinc finger protein [Holotrichia oblita]|uniref:Zinc finger protein n=1 Tax=Holotrichia oblita TaxID=644536 RepID=A0ACB9TC39_HOLOL|nr:zinc finger protein [Holotrichia oblita]
MWKPFLLLIILAMVNKGVPSDDKFLKKYALIKIFESCFGQDVVKEIRRELKAACMKCQNLDASPPSTPPPIPQKHIISQNKLDLVSEPENTMYANQQIFPTEKLQQAILAFRPNPYPQPSFRPYPGSPASFYQAFANPAPMYYGPNYSPNPFASSPYGFPFMTQPFFGNSRTSRIAALPISQEVRQDIQDGVTYCQQFSQCIPEPKKEASPLSRELTKPMLFFKCYKYKKLEACIMKDVREKISSISEEDLENDTDFRRTAKSMKHNDDNDQLVSTMYDLLYGADPNFELDNIF